jgi:hypothetical protein
VIRNTKKEKKKRNKGFPYKKTRKKLTIKEKKINDASILGFLFGWIVATLIFIVFILFIYNEPFFQQDIDSILLDKSFKIVANSWENTSIVNSLSYLCSLNEDDIARSFCVYSFISENVVYNNHDEGTNRLRKPDEIFNYTIVCRDVAVLYKSIMNKMNIENKFVFIPGHVYNEIYIENYKCKVDIVNEIFECYEIENI